LNQEPVFDQNLVMKINFTVILIFCLAVSGLAQQSEVRQIGAFQAVRVSEAIDVYLKKGEKESVKVEATGTDLSNVLTEVNGTTLKIHMRDGNFRGRKSVKVYVTYTRLEKLSASSASNLFSTDLIKSGKLEISVSSAGSVEVKLESESVIVNASSAGKTVLEGNTKSLEIEASSSAGSAKINVSKELQAHASSGGSIRYRGNPLKTNTDSSSGGSVKKTN